MKKHFHFVATLCFALNNIAYLAAQSADAQAIQTTVLDRVKTKIEPQMLSIRKNLKNSLKSCGATEKKEMRLAQKRLQEECNELKRKVYQEYAAMRASEEEAQRAAIASLKKASKEAARKSSTLRSTLDRTEQYVKLLSSHATSLGDTEVTRALEAEQAWLQNLEKTSIKAGISLDQSLHNEQKKEKKKKGRTIAV